jgi:hypothetical protein
MQQLVHRAVCAVEVHVGGGDVPTPVSSIDPPAPLLQRNRKKADPRTALTVSAGANNLIGHAATLHVIDLEWSQGFQYPSFQPSLPTQARNLRISCA